jgi:hypothetical protein
MWPGSGSGDVGGELGLVFGLGELVAEAGGFVAIFLRLLAVSWRRESQGRKVRSLTICAIILRTFRPKVEVPYEIPDTLQPLLA